MLLVAATISPAWQGLDPLDTKCLPETLRDPVRLSWSNQKFYSFLIDRQITNVLSQSHLLGVEKGLSKQPQATREGKGSPLIILPHNYCHYCPRCTPFIFFLKIALRPLIFDPTLFLELVLQNFAPRDTVCVSGSPTSGWFSGFLANCWQRHFPPPPLRWKLSPSPETPSPETWPCPVFHSEQISFFKDLLVHRSTFPVQGKSS